MCLRDRSIVVNIVVKLYAIMLLNSALTFSMDAWAYRFSVILMFACPIDVYKSQSLDFEGFGELTLAEHMVLNNDDMKAVNSPENPENVVPKKGTGVKDGVVILEPHSYNIVRFYTK